MIVDIKPSKLCGEVEAPPSKSYAHRLLIAAALSKDVVNISNVQYSLDILSTLDSLASLGSKFDKEDSCVKFKGFNKTFLESPLELGVRESGSTLRFMIPIALTFGTDFIFSGSERLFKRGLSVYEKIFDEQHIMYQMDTDHLHISGKLHGGNFVVDGSISSQFISGLLFACPLLEEDSVIEVTGKLESKMYIDMTLDVLKKFGVIVDVKANKYYINGRQQYKCIDYSVEGDYSNAAFLDAYNLVGGNVRLLGLNKDSLQGDKKYLECFELLKNGYCEIDLGNIIDLGPILFTVSSMFDGAKFINIKRLRIKESDRVNDMLCELAKFGVKSDVSENEVIIHKSILHTPIEILDPHNDHRICMSLAVIASVYGGRIKDAECIRKSFPDFFDVTKKLGLMVDYEIN